VTGVHGEGQEAAGGGDASVGLGGSPRRCKDDATTATSSFVVSRYLHSHHERRQRWMNASSSDEAFAVDCKKEQAKPTHTEVGRPVSLEAQHPA
jgi:hypothetical protein